MPLLAQEYESSGDEAPNKSQNGSGLNVKAAPEVSLEVESAAFESSNQMANTLQDPAQMALTIPDAKSTALTYNVAYEDLARPTQGPENPFTTVNGNSRKRKANVLTGDAHETVISDVTFNAQQRTYQSRGYAQDPTIPGAFVGNQGAAALYQGKDVIQVRPTKEASSAIRARRLDAGDPSKVEGPGAYRGPWAGYKTDGQEYEEEAAAAERELASDEEWVDETFVPSNMSAPEKASTAYTEDTSNAESTTFHGSSEVDYQGRTYMHIPQDLDVDLKKEPGTFSNYIPKKLVHSYKSHTKPINVLRFIPNSGHLLLSGSADSTIKLWDAHHERELLRTFSGHSKAITDCDFHSSGKTFLSSSYDRYIKQWDTEYGKCISRFSTGKTPHCIRFQPAEGGHEFIAGMSDKKIVQFDTRSGELTQEYDHHLGPINSLTFVDQNRRFISTSDDKSLRAWEYNIPVPIKFIADPSLYALVRSSLHPSGKYVAFQSSDNQIVVYAAGDKFRQNRKKAFRGHNTAGYAIDLAISPDGQFIASGDSGGFVCFWDWKTGKMYHKFLAGGKDGPGAGAVTCVQWHPQESSKVATGGLDGVIRYWD
ncbi:MAG: hypothetical protein Q9227_004950 [Pyrenula ochraceoflavens]